MKHFRPIYVEAYIIMLMVHDPDVVRIISTWELETNDIWTMLNEHYLDYGICQVEPCQQERFRKDLIFQLSHSQTLRQRREQIRREIARAREKAKARPNNENDAR